MTPVLESERLILKPLTVDFCNNKYLNWLNDPDVITFLDRRDTPYTMDMLREFVTRNHRTGVFFWAIIVKSTSSHIGNIKIDKIDFDKGSGEYGIMIGDKTAWGKGYAAESSRVVIDFCFRDLKLDLINLGVLANNVSAVNLYKKLGFVVTPLEELDSKNQLFTNLNYRMTLIKS